jgi:hypothetical protein
MNIGDINSSLPELVAVANTPQFGEADQPLAGFLLCHAFKVRDDIELSKALRLASMIIGRLSLPNSTIPSTWTFDYELDRDANIQV